MTNQVKGMQLNLEGLRKSFGNKTVLQGIDLEIQPGEFVAIVGRSGCGKSTMLRLVAGLDAPSGGDVLLNGKYSDKPINPAIRMMFQDARLLPWQRVLANVELGLIGANSKVYAKQTALQVLREVGLEDRAHEWPSVLSGGQRQRVALARALAVEPNVLLLDEPFGALDAKVRKDLRAWLRRLHDEVHVTTVFVTHDQEEAMEVSDEIVVMNKGKVEQVGTPANIYDHPASAFVMSFIGPVNVLPSSAKIFQSSGFISAHPETFLRPQDIIIETVANGTTAQATVSRVIHLGWEIQVELTLDDGQMMTAHLTRDRFDELKLEPQEKVYVKPKDAKSFPLYYSI